MSQSEPTSKVAEGAFGLSAEFLNILVCPLDHEKLETVPTGLRCTKCQRIYPVENGIPNFVIEE